jgi:hypothetical protein
MTSMTQASAYKFTLYNVKTKLMRHLGFDNVFTAGQLPTQVWLLKGSSEEPIEHENSED